MPKVRIDPSDLSERQRLARRRAFQVLDLMRDEGESLTSGSARVGTDPRTVKKYAGRALVQDEKGGRHRAKPWDRFIRVMRFPTPSGLIELRVKDSRSAERLARYWNAVRKFLSGQAGHEVLKPFEGKSITVDGGEHFFLTDSDVLRRLALAGEVQFNELYADI